MATPPVTYLQNITKACVDTLAGVRNPQARKKIVFDSVKRAYENGLNDGGAKTATSSATSKVTLAPPELDEVFQLAIVTITLLIEGMSQSSWNWQLGKKAINRLTHILEIRYKARLEIPEKD